MHSFIMGTTSVSVTGTGSPILNLLIGIIVMIGIVWFTSTGGFNFKKRYLLKHGVPVEVKVEQIEQTMFNVGQGANSRPVMKMTLSYEDSNKNKYEVSIKHAFSLARPIPDEGGHLSILIDSRNPQRIMIAPGSA